ncbi:MAG: NAD-dependent epimerase/dehydratase family protein [Symbiobacteriia bacterium]
MRDTVLVTGGSGFLGSHIVRRQVALGSRVVVPYRGETVPWRLSEVATLPGLTLVPRWDVRDTRAVRELIASARPNVVIHSAAAGVIGNGVVAEEVLAVNVVGTQHLMEACLRAGVKRFVLLGSGFEYRASTEPIGDQEVLEPNSIYGVSKMAAWAIADYYRRVAGMNVTTLRVFSPFGPKENPSRFIPYIITQLLAGKSPEMTAGHQVRDYLFVDDLVDAVLACTGIDTRDCPVLNLGGDARHTLAEVALMIREIIGTEVELNLNARPSSPTDRLVYVADSGMADRVLNWRPRIGLYHGLELTVEWYRGNWPLPVIGL